MDSQVPAQTTQSTILLPYMTSSDVSPLSTTSRMMAVPACRPTHSSRGRVLGLASSTTTKPAGIFQIGICLDPASTLSPDQTPIQTFARLSPDTVVSDTLKKVISGLGIQTTRSQSQKLNTYSLVWDGSHVSWLKRGQSAARPVSTNAVRLVEARTAFDTSSALYLSAVGENTEEYKLAESIRKEVDEAYFDAYRRNVRCADNGLAYPDIESGIDRWHYLEAQVAVAEVKLSAARSSASASLESELEIDTGGDAVTAGTRKPAFGARAQESECLGRLRADFLARQGRAQGRETEDSRDQLLTLLDLSLSSGKADGKPITLNRLLDSFGGAYVSQARADASNCRAAGCEMGYEGVKKFTTYSSLNTGGVDKVGLMDKPFSLVEYERATAEWKASAVFDQAVFERKLEKYRQDFEQWKSQNPDVAEELGHADVPMEMHAWGTFLEKILGEERIRI